MTKEQYLTVSAPFREKPRRQRQLQRVNHIGTAVVYAAYILLLLGRILRHDVWFWRVLLIPAAAFFILSACRRVINAPRPYEVWNLTPLLEKDTKGKSFPSRHVFSAAIIAMAVLSVHITGGIVLLAVTVLLAWCRVIAGVHFIKDVLAAAIIGVAAGMIGFFVIP